MSTPLFSARGLNTGYPDRPVIEGLDVDIAEGEVTCLIGPNGCGKSTLLKTMCGLLSHGGSLTFQGREVGQWPRKERARELSLLPQTPVAPPGLTVGQLVSRGRHPYQSWMAQWSREDDAVVTQALETTGLTELADRRIADLSGGQRQRVWIAMTIAQDTPTMLLDEPTTYLDLSTSVEVLRLVRGLREESGRTVVMVLHDLNLAARYADRLVLLARGGRLAGVGTPAEVLSEENLAEVFDLDAVVVEDPVSGGPLVVPR
ncbi:ABC transporter ATP-binding protein [Corynebacterium lowii]|uniref:Putative siderophore transport system ATP-binding protein YusV n=1 Tax=Corynebacterium lowii TaxID=1544413 RepID=A0A0Q0YNE0_9CORY|nr:ABC transporter ATP-binding protein [Corynebacterium lowii]KQB83985.1 putative siderophore transport system ATP-binding protein YusV [Corynebacterium lowii]MDP9852765.1 iron complex transport system ATP-binding protein [Corynebacterium lowii]